MKENSPKKIWVHELSAKELSVPLTEYHIEYIRKDAVIEWLKEFNGCHYIMRYSDCCEVSLNRIIEDFKNYMKGK